MVETVHHSIFCATTALSMVSYYSCTTARILKACKQRTTAATFLFRLHLAVGMEQPNLETVRNCPLPLCILFLKAPAPVESLVHMCFNCALALFRCSSQYVLSGGGCLPLHLCVNRGNPSLPAFRALVDIYM